ncbi:MAG: PEP-CTERM sorting domain-containing protein [Rubrivivax sp.]
MKKLMFATMAAAAAMAATAPAHALGLEGDNVTVALTITGFPAFLCSNCTASFTVGAGVEGSIYNNTQAVDFGAYSFSITSSGNFSQFGFNPAPADRPVTLRLSSLDFGMPLTGVVVTSSLNGPVTTTFGNDFAQFVFFDQPVSAGQTYISAQFLTAPVPEPHTVALMLAGLGALGFLVRRRKV